MNFKEFWEWFTTDQSKVRKQSVQRKLPQKSVTPGQKIVIRKQPAVVPKKELTSRDSTGKRKLGYAVLLFILINSILGSSLFYLPSLYIIDLFCHSPNICLTLVYLQLHPFLCQKVSPES